MRQGFPAARVQPDPAAVGQLREAMEDVKAYDALAGRHRSNADVVRDGVRTLGDVDATVLLVSLLDQDWPLAGALRAVWNLADVDYAALVAYLQRERLLTWTEVHSALTRAGVDRDECLSLLKLLDTGR